MAEHKTWYPSQKKFFAPPVALTARSGGRGAATTFTILSSQKAVPRAARRAIMVWEFDMQADGLNIGTAVMEQFIALGSLQNQQVG